MLITLLDHTKIYEFAGSYKRSEHSDISIIKYTCDASYSAITPYIVTYNF